MQAGFSMLEVGAVRAKNGINILYKNILDASVAALGFWCVPKCVLASVQARCSTSADDCRALRSAQACRAAPA